MKFGRCPSQPSQPCTFTSVVSMFSVAADSGAASWQGKADLKEFLCSTCMACQEVQLGQEAAEEGEGSSPEKKKLLRKRSGAELLFIAPWPERSQGHFEVRQGHKYRRGLAEMLLDLDEVVHNGVVATMALLAWVMGAPSLALHAFCLEISYEIFDSFSLGFQRSSPAFPYMAC